MESFGIINYLTYFLGTIMIILLPGPNSLYVLSLSAQQGMKNGWAAAAGIFVGDALLIIATVLGAASVLTKYPLLFWAIKFAGAFYLSYIGIRLIIHGYKTWKSRNFQNVIENAPVLKKVSSSKAFNKALMVSLLNPKAILFFLSFFVQFVDPTYPNPFLPFAILAFTLQVCSFLYLATLIYAGSRLASAFAKRKKMSAVSNASVGMGFIGFAIKLALAAV